MSDVNAITKAELDQCVVTLKQIAQEIDDDFQISVFEDGKIYFGWGGNYDAVWVPLGAFEDAPDIIVKIRELIEECVQLLPHIDQMDDGYGPRETT